MSGNAWNLIDVLLALVVLLNVLQGVRRGFLRGAIGLVAWAAGLVAALIFYQPAAAWLGPRAPWPDVWDRPVAFVLIATVVSALISAVGYALIAPPRRPDDAARTPAQRHPLDRLLGALPGFVNGLIAAAILAALLLALPLPAPARAAVRQSALTNRLADYTDRLEIALSPVFGDAVAQTLQRLTVAPASHETIKLPFTVADAQPAPDLEEQMLKLVNGEREAAGLPSLEADPALAEVARRHSADMLAKGYFSHISPDGLDPFARLRAAGITYRAASENLALAPTLELAHSGLMRSPGHRANILSQDFGRVGIGIMDAGVRGIMVTQVFRN